ncbi:MAG TPA: hypothetical protein VER96_11520 [Polyangiaceae bacterium]|nr:hypothetical protein [Polyangiaceae bacterium]
MTRAQDFKRALLASLGSVALLVLPQRAHADDPRLGVDLFQSGRQLMNDGNYEKACPMLRDSQKADPQPGTLLNLALCYEKLGKTASAWSTYTDLIQSGGPLQQQAAKDAIQRLGPKLSRLKVELCATPNFDAKQLVVRRNGEVLGDSALGRPSPVDAGEYVIEARVPGFEKWSRAVTVGANGDLQTVEVCTLEHEAAALATAAAPAAGVVTATPPASLAASSDVAQPRAKRDWTPVYIAGGAGIVAATLGTVFGVIAANQKADANKLCPNNACSPAGWEQLDSAKTSADISTVSFIVAGVAAGATAYFALKPSPAEVSPKPTKAARLAVGVVPSGFSVSCGGAF